MNQTPVLTMDLQSLIDLLPDLTPNDRALVERAYFKAETAHAGQFRKSGEPYFTHCVAVAHILAEMKFTSDKTVYVSCTVFEEDCDGENLKYLFKELDLKPGYVVICEPSDNVITLGHKGKAQVSIKTRGVSAHGSAPEKGVNAIYEMAEIIQRVDKANLELMKKGEMRGTLVMSRISSVSASLNAVPSECEVYLDRRIIPGETENDIRREMDQLIKDKNASWEIGTLHRKSWTGMEITYEPFHLAWKIDLSHELARACIAAYQENFEANPTNMIFGISAPMQSPLSAWEFPRSVLGLGNTNSLTCEMKAAKWIRSLTHAVSTRE